MIISPLFRRSNKICLPTIKTKPWLIRCAIIGSLDFYEKKQSSCWAPVLRPKTSKTLFGPVNFSLFYLELYKNKFKNLIRTSKLKCSFRGLLKVNNSTNINKMNNHLSYSLTEHKKKIQTYDVGNWGSRLGRAQKCGGVNPLNVIQALPSWFDLFFLVIFGVLTPLLKIFQLYHGDQF